MHGRLKNYSIYIEKECVAQHLDMEDALFFVEKLFEKMHNYADLCINIQREKGGEVKNETD